MMVFFLNMFFAETRGKTYTFSFSLIFTQSKRAIFFRNVKKKTKHKALDLFDTFSVETFSKNFEQKSGIN